MIEQLGGRLAIAISIDTMKPAVARAALRAGASIINDVAANRDEDEMWRLAAQSGAGYVLTHMLGSPENMQKNPVYKNVVEEVNEERGKLKVSVNMFGRSTSLELEYWQVDKT